MKSNKLLPVLICLSLLSVLGCTSSEIGESKDVAQHTIFQQYNISYTEDDETVRAYAQFRFAGGEGTTLVLTKPSSLQFDGKTLQVDSSEFEGAFYKEYFALNDFYGTHRFVFTDINNRKYDNRFSFNDFKLGDIPATVPADQPLQISFVSTPLQPDDHIEIVSVDTDSSFNITYAGADANKFIAIPAKELQRQTAGQVKIAATLYRKIPLQQSTREGGTIELQHALKPVNIKLAE